MNIKSKRGIIIAPHLCLQKEKVNKNYNTSKTLNAHLFTSGSRKTVRQCFQASHWAATQTRTIIIVGKQKSKQMPRISNKNDNNLIIKGSNAKP